VSASLRKGGCGKERREDVQDDPRDAVLEPLDQLISRRRISRRSRPSSRRTSREPVRRSGHSRLSLFHRAGVLVGVGRESALEKVSLGVGVSNDGGVVVREGEGKRKKRGDGEEEGGGLHD
jgi:hypothetical protein